MDLVVEVYKCSKFFPKEESFGLTSQMRRCAVSVPSNLAEGYGRHSNNELLRFSQIATGSLYELQTQLEISVSLEYLSKDGFEKVNELTREVERMLNSLTRRLENQSQAGKQAK
jgi:four helix bundle protein